MQHVDQRKSYIETTTQLLDNIHRKQSASVVPPYETHTAIDVLSTGTYGKLPAFPMRQEIELRRIVLGWEPPTSAFVLEDLNRRLRHRVSQSSAAEMFTNVVVSNGRVVVHQEYEFRVELTLESNNWRVLHTDCLVGESRDCKSLHAQPYARDILPVIKRLLEAAPRRNPTTYKQLWDHMKYVLTEAQRIHPEWNIDITHIYEIKSKLQLQNAIVAELSKHTLDDSLLRMYHVAHQHCYLQAQGILHRQADTDRTMTVLSSSERGLNVQYWRATATRPPCCVLVSVAQNKQGLTTSHIPALPMTHKAAGTLDTMNLDIRRVVENAKCMQASVMLINAWDALIETLPWFLTPGDVRLTWQTGRATSLKVSINAGAMDFMLLVDIPTGHYRCSMVANAAANAENHPPMSSLVSSCPMRDVEKRINTFGGERAGVDERLGATLASILGRIQASIINAELSYAAERSGLVRIAPRRVVLGKEGTATTRTTRTTTTTTTPAHGFWNHENTTLYAKEGESRLFCVCVGAGSDADSSVRRRYLWPPLCEIIPTVSPVVHTASLGPFRSSIQILSTNNRQMKNEEKIHGTSFHFSDRKRKRETRTTCSDSGVMIHNTTIGTDQAVEMLTLLCSIE